VETIDQPLYRVEVLLLDGLAQNLQVLLMAIFSRGVIHRLGMPLMLTG
jgi:hypothetical protein